MVDRVNGLLLRLRKRPGFTPIEADPKRADRGVDPVHRPCGRRKRDAEAQVRRRKVELKYASNLCARSHDVFQRGPPVARDPLAQEVVVGLGLEDRSRVELLHTNVNRGLRRPLQVRQPALEWELQVLIEGSDPEVYPVSTAAAKRADREGQR